jgi:hypothetical protein
MHLPAVAGENWNKMSVGQFEECLVVKWFDGEVGQTNIIMEIMDTNRWSRH